MTKTLDTKLAQIHADPEGSDAFILAYAADADMAFGIAAPGLDRETGAPRSLASYRDGMREIVRQALVDVVLMSVSTSELLTREEGLFDGSPVTPAVRANDSTDIHLLRGAAYRKQPSWPFRTPTVEQVAGAAGVDLALYSLTPCGLADHDVVSLAAYRDFRGEAAAAGLRHFLEVFAPNLVHVAPADTGCFVNDFVARTLAGVPKADRPLFLKLPYAGGATMRELAAYDPHLVPGILGGAAGTSLDAFALLEAARLNGARAALFGRKIRDSEHPPTFVRHLRALADGEAGAEEARRAYQRELQSLGAALAR